MEEAVEEPGKEAVAPLCLGPRPKCKEAPYCGGAYHLPRGHRALMSATPWAVRCTGGGEGFGSRDQSKYRGVSHGHASVPVCLEGIVRTAP